jgi:hypothetical protein
VQLEEDEKEAIAFFFRTDRAYSAVQSALAAISQFFIDG